MAPERARRLNDRGIGAILSHLGEHYDERGPADEDTETYCTLLGDLAMTDLYRKLLSQAFDERAGGITVGVTTRR